MDRFGPAWKVSKKLVHLLRWTRFPGRTGWNFGWMDRARSVQCGTFYFMISFLDFQVTTSGDEDGIHWATFRYFLKRMTFFHSVSFVCPFTHVFSGAFANSAMASPVVGSVGQFDPSSETFTAYLEIIDLFFEAGDIGKSSEDLTAAVIRNWWEDLEHSSRFVQLC